MRQAFLWFLLVSANFGINILTQIELLTITYIIVEGDRDLLDLGSFKNIKIMTANEFLEETLDNR